MKKAKRIVVGLKNLEHAVELTDLACRIGARGASLLLVHVVELPAATPLDAELPDVEATARKMFRAAERVARRGGMKVSKLILHARSAGDALIDVLKDKKSDMAVLGYHHAKAIGEILLGTTARHVARHAPCHVLMSIPPRG